MKKARSMYEPAWRLVEGVTAQSSKKIPTKNKKAPVTNCKMMNISRTLLIWLWIQRKGTSTVEESLSEADSLSVLLWSTFSLCRIKGSLDKLPVVKHKENRICLSTTNQQLVLVRRQSMDNTATLQAFNCARFENQRTWSQKTSRCKIECIEKLAAFWCSEKKEWEIDWC